MEQMSILRKNHFKILFDILISFFKKENTVRKVKPFFFYKNRNIIYNYGFVPLRMVK